MPLPSKLEEKIAVCGINAEKKRVHLLKSAPIASSTHRCAAMNSLKNASAVERSAKEYIESFD